MIVWDKRKRASNLVKHGLDFADAWLVYDNPAKVTFESTRAEETRLLDLAPVDQLLLVFIYVERGARIRAISLRRASRAERRIYEQIVKKNSH